jgi:acyl-CoA synthetase (NDP forming)/GNAT superfamily N-acetyltransferase
VDAEHGHEHWDSDVVLRDGTTARVRVLRPDDAPAVRELCEHASQRSLYYRFFTAMSAERAGEIEAGPLSDYHHHCTLVTEVRSELVGLARYDRRHADDDEAEVAFLVRDDWHGHGVGTILLEHLAAVAVVHGIQRFTAYTLTRNRQMLEVFARSGFPCHRDFENGTFRVVLDLVQSTTGDAAIAAREQVAESRSIARLLRPGSVAVVGASRERGTIGNAVLRNVLDGGFHGPVFAINRGAARAGETVEGLTAYEHVGDVPGEIGLAVVCVPAAQVLSVAEECVTKGVTSLVVISAGFAEIGDADAQHRLTELLRANGARLVGPNCIGIVNTADDVRLNATFLPTPAIRGRVGVASQSGGLAIELLARAGSIGLGVSTFVSLGNKADVSGNDVLQYWGDDPETDVIVMYLESFGNPHKFARLARRIGGRKPILAVKGGRTAAGARGAASHTAALVTPDGAVDALFRQAGVVRVDTLEQLFDAANLLLHQPLPAGRRVAIVTNGGGPGILAADACVAAGLEVPELSDDTQRALRGVIAREASVQNPVDLIASASAGVYEAAMRVLVADPGIDAVLVIFVPPLVTDADDVSVAICRVAADADDTTMAACFLGHNGQLDVLTDQESADVPAPRVPSYAFPESAAHALAHAARLTEWRARPVGVVPAFDDTDLVAARELVIAALVPDPEGTWLDTASVERLLSCAGIPLVTTRLATTADEAVAAFEDLGAPVAAKAVVPGLLHKTDAGGVLLDLTTADAVRVAFETMHETFGDSLRGIGLQPMAEPGVETIAGITRDPTFGPLVLFGMGGVTAELLRDTTLRITPVTDVDAHEMVRALRTSPLLFGHRGSEPVDIGALEDLVLRIGLLADAVPEIAELDCNPAIAGPHGVLVVDARVRVAAVGAAPLRARRLRDA